MEIEIASRQEYKAYIHRPPHRLYPEFLRQGFPGKFQHPALFLPFPGKFQKNRVLFQRRASADLDLIRTFFSEFHPGKYQRHVVPDLPYPPAIPFEAVAVDRIALPCRKPLPCTAVSLEGKAFDMHLYIIAAKDPAGPWSNACFIRGADGIAPSSGA